MDKCVTANSAEPTSMSLKSVMAPGALAASSGRAPTTRNPWLPCAVPSSAGSISSTRRSLMATGTANGWLQKQRVKPAEKSMPPPRCLPRTGFGRLQPGVGIEEVFPYEYIIRSAEQSLRNLGVETIDLLQLHVWNPEWIGRDEWRRAFADLRQSGKILACGVSINDHQPDSALELIRTGLIDSVQVIYNVFDQSPEENLFPLCVERNIGVIARVPLDEGALTGSVTEQTTFPPGDFRQWYFRGDHKRQVVEHVD